MNFLQHNQGLGNITSQGMAMLLAIQNIIQQNNYKNMAERTDIESNFSNMAFETGIQAGEQQKKQQEFQSIGDMINGGTQLAGGLALGAIGTNVAKLNSDVNSLDHLRSLEKSLNEQNDTLTVSGGNQTNNANTVTYTNADKQNFLNYIQDQGKTTSLPNDYENKIKAMNKTEVKNLLDSIENEAKPLEKNLNLKLQLHQMFSNFINAFATGVGSVGKGIANIYAADAASDYAYRNSFSQFMQNGMDTLKTLNNLDESGEPCRPKTTFWKSIKQLYPQTQESKTYYYLEKRGGQEDLLFFIKNFFYLSTIYEKIPHS